MTKNTHLKNYDVTLITEDTNQTDVRLDAKILPTDVHLVEYVEEGKTKFDSVRAIKMSDVFDGYWDLGVKDITSITTGYGTLRPNLYNVSVKKEDS